MIQKSIKKVVSGVNLTKEEAYDSMKNIMTGECTDAQIACYITALRMKGETADEIGGSAQAMREACTAVHVTAENVVDTCGTGGDGANTFNISTASAIVAAAAGVTVAKHGNKSVSSKSGSADVLTALGVNISVSPEKMETCLAEIGIAFLFAPSLHPAMKYAIGPRKEMGIRSIFNVLGPLTNPAGAKRGVLGVYSKDIVEMVATAAAGNGAERLFVVHGSDGLDEITITGNTTISEVNNGKVTSYEFDPTSIGLELASIESLVGGEPEENAQIIRDIFDGKEGPCADIVCLNAGAAIVAGGLAEDLAGGFFKAKEAISNGAAKAKLSTLAKLTK